jgi:hypothetical protein
MTEASEQPPITERVMDGVTDAQYTAAQLSESIRIAGARLREAIEQTRNSSVVTRIEVFTRAYPLLAVTAAFVLGAWVFGRRD